MIEIFSRSTNPSTLLVKALGIKVRSTDAIAASVFKLYWFGLLRPAG